MVCKKNNIINWSGIVTNETTLIGYMFVKKVLGLLGFILTVLTVFTLHAQTILFKNINGYTLAGNDNNSLVHFSAIQFSHDKVDRIFLPKDELPSNKEINLKDIRVINGEGKTLVPGLIDAHGHVLSYGLSLMQVELAGVKSEQAAVDRAVKFHQKLKREGKKLQWILGRGWNQVLWKNKQFPNALSLNEYFKDIPVWFKRIDGHAGWANAKAMALAGVTSESVSPDGGEILKDEHGQPTGVFIDNAMLLITANIPQPNQQEIKFALTKAMNALASVGLTSVHDAGINSENIKAFKALVVEQNMPIRVNAMIDINDQHIDELLAQGHFASADDMFIINSVKISADGALGSRGAALIQDYSDKKGHKGLMLYSQAVLEKFIEAVMKAGFQVNTHAIGDNANKLILDLYQRFISKTNSKGLRHRIEHAQILRLEDIPRFAQLGVIASMQATHATSDKNMAQDRLGEQRILGAYAWQKLLKANAVIAGGSDFPIESANPFFGLHASITRQDKNNQPAKGWFAQENMSMKQAFKSFTIDAAYAGHQEKIIGSLAQGKKADFILLDQDIFTVKKADVWRTQVLQTWVNGQQVYAHKESHIKAVNE